MNVLIIDDERLARLELRRLLAVHPALQVVGEAANAVDGRGAIEELRPDLVFLDVQMPGGSGFDLLASLDDPPPVIFTTAFDQYALRAFDVSALDYLLKPIEPARLAHAVNKASRAPDAQKNERQAPDGKVFIKDGERCWFVALEQIVLFESEGNYTRVYFDRNRPLLLRSLNQLEAKLDPERFLRVSRRQIVNLDFVVGIAPSAAGSMVLTLKDDLKVPMSRRRAAQFRQLNGL
ncbi:response regulator transcription factor [Massilia sp. Dwa41.01b]|uniref:LytR/AlgR family response regulator transcription factor n=1 Tax=unclassified Massilia TaxID=2609279 RepID=UPI0016020692|nr:MULTISPECIES: LytTR family DNA-binding domain-containing protein [unclassified Massilia]QNA88016.1 response regulator transcription factor [Massilia sp. Dwa41.01b]QNA98918.1 response regulator transcription factor [Massilia sp. Se16.2.3]